MIIIPSLHTAALLRGTDDSGLAKFENTVIRDFEKALRLTKSRPTWDEQIIFDKDASGRLWRLFPTPDEVIDFCQRAKGTTVAADVETTGESPLACRLLCVGLGSTNGEIICVPFLKKGGAEYWAPHDKVRVAMAIRDLMADAGTSKLFHNAPFDTVVLWAQGFPVLGRIDDTMQGHHVEDAELPHNLAYCASLHTDGRYWKDDVKGKEGWLGQDDLTLRSYNLRDILSTLRIAKPIFDKIIQYGQWDLYQEELQAAALMARATVRGMAVDFDRRDSFDPELEVDPKTKQPTGKLTGFPRGLGPKLTVQMNAALATLRQIAGTNEFQPSKPDHLRWLLFQRLQLPILKMSASGQAPSTDKDAMVMLALAASTAEQKAAIQALADFRTAQKLLSTFIQGLPVLSDGRFHPTWKLLAVTGRFMSSPNAQNWPKIVKKMFMAGPGMRYVGVDLSQAELRGIAYFANDKRLLEMYRSNINVHTVNAALLFNVKPPVGHKDMDPQTEAYCRQIIPELLSAPNDDFDAYPSMGGAQWSSTRTLAKNFQFGKGYGALDETVHDVLRAKRDPDTNKLLFPNLKLADTESMGASWMRLNAQGIVKWWDRHQAQVKARGYAVCPVSGRRRWFRGGFKRNEILNWNIQTLIASIMNKRMLKIQAIYDAETGGAAQIIQQVHDALNAEVPADYTERAKQVMHDVLSEPFELRIDTQTYFPDATLPPDKPIDGSHLDQV